MSELPPGWYLASVGEVSTEVRSGYASGKHNASGTGIPHLRPMNVNRLGSIDLADVKYVDPEVDDRRLVAGDILFNNTNSPALVGKTAVFNASEEFGFSNHMTRIRVRPGINPAFVAAQLHFRWMTGALSHLITNHVNQASISARVLAEQVTLVVVPSAEQERIVAAIEEHLSRLRYVQDALRMLGYKQAKFRQAVLHAAFTTGLDGVGGTHETRPLGEVLDMLLDHRGKTPKKLGGDFVDAGVRVVSAIHIKGGRVRFEERDRFVTPEMFERWMPQRTRAGDVLLTSEAPLGSVAVIESDDPLVLSQRLFCLRGAAGVLSSQYLRYFLESPDGQQQLARRSSGTTVTGIRQAELRQLAVPVPPLHDQEKVVELLEES